MSSFAFSLTKRGGADKLTTLLYKVFLRQTFFLFCIFSSFSTTYMSTRYPQYSIFLCNYISCNKRLGSCTCRASSRQLNITDKHGVSVLQSHVSSDIQWMYSSGNLVGDGAPGGYFHTGSYFPVWKITCQMTHNVVFGFCLSVWCWCFWWFLVFLSPSHSLVSFVFIWSFYDIQ